MRKYLQINLNDHSVETEELHGEDIARAGRYLIAKTLLDQGVATVEPLSDDNPLIFSVGPFAGTNWSNANRISVGCKSPLTGGVKESNSGGTFGFALGQLEIAGFTLNGSSDDWTVIYIPLEGEIRFEDATPYLGKGNFEAAKLLHEKYGDKVSLALCGPVGEYQGLMSGIAFSDQENRPVRLAARGGVGAVMGYKKVKAIVAEQHKMPTFEDRRKVMGGVKEYGKLLGEQQAITNLSTTGTALVADLTNHLGGLPVRNFSSGSLTAPGEVLKIGGDYIRELNSSRGGEISHACMPGCMIKCSNVYVNKEGEEVVSPMEYETIGLMGTNCGLNDPDDIAIVNQYANDLGVDTIEMGATLAIMMDHGLAEFGDIDFMIEIMKEMGEGTERGKIIAQATHRVGEHYGIKRVPVIKKQALSAYDPRVIEVTGITMMVTAQGADHTVGNLPGHESKGKPTEEIAEASYNVQINSAVADSTGLCLFGRTVTDVNAKLIVDAINGGHGTKLEPEFLKQLARDTLDLEYAFNKAAGFTEEDDKLPAFMYDEALPPMNRAARHTIEDVTKFKENWHQTNSAS